MCRRPFNHKLPPFRSGGGRGSEFTSCRAVLVCSGGILLSKVPGTCVFFFHCSAKSCCKLNFAGRTQTCFSFSITSRPREEKLKDVISSFFPTSLKKKKEQDGERERKRGYKLEQKKSQKTLGTLLQTACWSFQTRAVSSSQHRVRHQTNGRNQSVVFTSRAETEWCTDSLFNLLPTCFRPGIWFTAELPSDFWQTGTVRRLLNEDEQRVKRHRVSLRNLKMWWSTGEFCS